MSLYKRLTALGVVGAVALSGAYLIAPSEGLVTKTYLDPIGILTSCYGHTGKELKLGQVFTQAQCDKQFATDLTKHDEEMSKFVRVPWLSDYEHAGVLSFCYNVGIANCTNSTLMRKLNEGDHIAACKELAKWTRAGGKDCHIAANNCSGIITRRDKEMKFCLGEITSLEDNK